MSLHHSYNAFIVSPLGSSLPLDLLNEISDSLFTDSRIVEAKYKACSEMMDLFMSSFYEKHSSFLVDTDMSMYMDQLRKDYKYGDKGNFLPLNEATKIEIAEKINHAAKFLYKFETDYTNPEKFIYEAYFVLKHYKMKIDKNISRWFSEFIEGQILDDMEGRYEQGRLTDIEDLEEMEHYQEMKAFYDSM